MESKKQNTVFVGFHISPEMDQYLRLNAVARNISVSQILRELTSKWEDDCEITEKKLISGIVERIKTNYMILSLKDEVDRVEFFNKWKSILSKKLTIPIVNKVIQEYETQTTSPQ
jgi:hypothetical protein